MSGASFGYLAQPQEAARSAPARRPLSAAHESDRDRSGQALGVLPAAGRGRGGVQDAQRRSGHPADLPSARAPHRGAHLHRLPRLLPARDARSSTQISGAGAHHAQRAGEILRRADDRRAHPDHRRARARAHALHAAGGRTEAALERLKLTLPPQPPPKITAARPPPPLRVVQTFGGGLPENQALPLRYPSNPRRAVNRDSLVFGTANVAGKPKRSVHIHADTSEELGRGDP